jgi:glyoxylase-like metal-dependent hydrolase (beta-lactamase superfamily II)
MHRRGAPFLADANLNLSAPCGRYVTIGTPVDWLDDGDEVRLAANPAYSIRVLHTPGHTPDSVTYHLPSENCAFVGDTIIDGNVGLTKFPGGDQPTLIRSLETRILTLPADTTLLSGHSAPLTLREFLT